MADLKRAADELTAKAAFDAAKKAAERALDDALSTDEERAARKAEEAALAKKKRTKLIAMSVVGLLLVLGVIGMVVNYWQWFFLLGLVGLLALYGRHRWRTRGDTKPDVAPPVVSAASKKQRAPAPRRVSEGASARAPARPERDVEEKTATRELDEAAIEDELAELKARLK
ncbi:MAG: hypothetical protein IPI67_10985 [Myxococcales bacterium]|nr:hypothetical protein [Myxococcales bacterium]